MHDVSPIRRVLVACRRRGLTRSPAGRHAPAHALPRAERSKLDATFGRVKHKRHGAHSRARATKVSSERPAARRARLGRIEVRSGKPRRLHAVDDLLGAKSVWQRCVRVVGTPAFGVATCAYLAFAWVIIGAEASHPPSGGAPAVSNDGIDPRSAHAGEQGISSNSEAPVDEPPSTAPTAVDIDPKFYANLQSVLNGIDEQTRGDQPSYPQQDTSETTHGGSQVTAPGPALDTLVPTGAPIPGPVVDPNGGTAAALPSDSSAPLPSAVIPDDQDAASPPPAAPLSPPSVSAPPS